MALAGTPERPLRVAIVGSGPAGFYAAQHLFRTKELNVQVDMFDRLPTPFGLVRHGVAPDHQKIKSVVAVYDKIARREEFRFFGNVEYGRDLTLEEMKSHYHQIVFSTGAQTDRRLGIPGEDLAGSFPATEFVAWYNGHPDFRDLEFDLSCERAVVIGVGNVAVDVARILSRTPEELARTDIADYALEALKDSRIREVLLLGRRGPAQAAFTNPEVKELGELEGAACSTLADEVELDSLSLAELEQAADKATSRKIDILKSYVDRKEPDKPRRLVIRFLVSPTEIRGSERVESIRLARNELYADDAGRLRSRTTDHAEWVDTGLIFRSVGYRGVALAELPFDEGRGIVPNEQGRVALPGIYVAGWIKRGPSGVIGTNKPDAKETVGAMLGDLEAGTLLTPSSPGPDAIPSLLESKRIRFVTYDDWLELDRQEVARGEPLGRPRLKFTDRSSLLDAVGR